jgi:TRAP-type C4-dicarboxylate transport system permease small subunit
MRAAVTWLRARADNVAVGLLTAMFLTFILQIVARYLFNFPIGWTLELCLTTWLWVVFWEGAFILGDSDHIRFDLLYHVARPRLQRTLAIVGALGILVGFAAALPATIDYIAFYKIKRSSTLHIRLDYVFSVYGVFAVATIVRYAIRAWKLATGAGPSAPDSLPER